MATGYVTDRIECEGACCCQCSFCAGNGYHTSYDIVVTFAGEFVDSKYNTAAPGDEPTVGTCLCSDLTYSVTATMRTDYDGVTGGLAEGPDHVVAGDKSCCLWGFDSKYNGACDRGCGLSYVSGSQTCEEFAAGGSNWDNIGISACGDKYTNGKSNGETASLQVGGTFPLITAPYRELFATEDCTEEGACVVIVPGGFVASIPSVADRDFCSKGATFSKGDGFLSEDYLPIWPNGSQAAAIVTKCYVDTVTVTPTPGSWRQCGQNEDGTPVDEPTPPPMLMAAIRKAAGPNVRVNARNSAEAACPLRGEPTGETVTCRTCAGRVELKLFACSVHGTCTVGKKAEGVACCEGCPDRPKAAH